MAPPRRISVIIPSFNRPDYLRRVLVSLAAQTRLVDEVVISDDGSSVDVPEAIADALPALPFPVHFVRQPDEGFRAAKCRNNGIRAATGEYLIFGDQDIVLDRSYVETFARRARPGEFLVGYPARLDEEQTARVTEEMVRAGTAAQLASPRERWLVRKQYLKDRWYRVLHALHLRPIGPKLRSGVFGAWRADLLAVNGFDEEYRGWGGEDDNLGARLHRAGIRGRNVFPRVVTVHLHHPPHHIEGGRSSADHHARAWRAIRAGQVRARHGIENPLGGDVSERRTVHEPSAGERRASRAARSSPGSTRCSRPSQPASGRNCAIATTSTPRTSLRTARSLFRFGR